MFPIFRQKIGNVYHFDIMVCIKNTWETYIIGSLLINCKNTIKKHMYTIYKAGFEDQIDAFRDDVYADAMEFIEKCETIF